MIKLSNSPVKVWTSSVYEHPVQTGDNYVTYTLNHNLGVLVDEVHAYKTGDGDPAYKVITDYMYAGGSVGYDIRAQNINSIDVDMYRLNSVPVKIYFKVFAFGGDHRAS